MSRCLRGIILLCALGLLLFSVPTYAQTSQVVIAVIHPGDAMNPVIEEVYYKANPNSEIVYALYAEDQLKTALLSGKIDFDLLIQPIEQVHSYGKDGYLENLYSVMGFAHWPDDFLDIQHQIELEGSLYGLPAAVYQTVWSWNDALAQATGIKKPSLPWTWDDYKALSELLPVDINMDGTKDAYLMYGQKTQDAALSNVQLDNLYTYFRSYPGDFSSERFRNQLDIFAGIVNTPSLLPWPEFSLYAFFIWRYLGVSILIYLSGLFRIEYHIIEAARLEGAGSWLISRSILLPLLTRTSMFNLVFMTVFSLRMFREVYLLYGAYPPQNLYFVQHYLSNHFARLNYQRLSAAAVLLAAFLSMLFMLIIHAFQKREQL